MSFDLSHDLIARQAKNLYRRRLTLDGPQGPKVVVDGQVRLAFCSNDYLGLANHPQVVAALRCGAERYGVGSGASHLVSGHSTAHHRLEEELAEFVGTPRTLLFSTGYMANLGVVSALLGRDDAVFEDRLNHASLVDAGLLSRAALKRYHHADTGALARLLAGTPARRRLVVTDGVFSMDGDVAPLAELVTVAGVHAAGLLVDDAHGLGVLGRNGRGTFEHLDLPLDGSCILMGTLGKAFGVFGAFVAAGEEVIETLIQKARTYLYTTALPPAVAEAARASLRLVRAESWRRDHLRDLIRRFRHGAADLGLPLAASDTPIQPLILGDPGKALAVSEALRARGILVMAIRPPTVPVNTARLRITLSAAHRFEDVDCLLDALDRVGSAVGVRDSVAI